MAVKSRTYEGLNGATSITDPLLAYRKIVSVKREGVGYNIVTDTPGNREVQYVASNGGFVFEIPFSETITSHPSGQYDIRINEKIFIIWEE